MMSNFYIHESATRPKRKPVVGTTERPPEWLIGTTFCECAWGIMISVLVSVVVAVIVDVTSTVKYCVTVQCSLCPRRGAWIISNGSGNGPRASTAWRLLPRTYPLFYDARVLILRRGPKKRRPNRLCGIVKDFIDFFLALVIDQVLKCYNSRKHSISCHRAQDEIIIDQGSLGQVDVWDSVHRYDVDRCIVVDVHVVAPIRCSDEEGSIIVSVHEVFECAAEKPPTSIASSPRLLGLRRNLVGWD